MKAFLGAQLDVRNFEYSAENPGDLNPGVLLTDTNRWPGPARLALRFSKAGCRVSAVCPTGHPMRHTRAVHRVFNYSSLRPVESLAIAIEATKPQIVIPCDDRAVGHLHELFARARREGAAGSGMARLIERSLGSPESYAIVSSRYDLLKTAREEGLRVPATVSVKTVDDFRTWQEQQVLPWVLKADGTFGGRGVRVAHSRGEAERAFLEMSRPHRFKRVVKRLLVNRDPFWMRPWWNRHRPAVIAQAQVKGRPANCTFASWKGSVLACICVEVVSSEGATGPATIVRVVDNQEMVLAAERLARRLRLSGFYGLDFMIEQGSGVSYLIEMNPRCTPLSHLPLGSGRDLVEAVWSQLSGQPIRQTPPITENPMIAYFPQAWARKSELLQLSYHDIPKDEPDLVQELLRPWPDRSLLFRLASKAQVLTTAVSTSQSYD